MNMNDNFFPYTIKVEMRDDLKRKCTHLSSAMRGHGFRGVRFGEDIMDSVFLQISESDLK